MATSKAIRTDYRQWPACEESRWADPSRPSDPDAPCGLSPSCGLLDARHHPPRLRRAHLRTRRTPRPRTRDGSLRSLTRSGRRRRRASSWCPTVTTRTSGRRGACRRRARTGEARPGTRRPPSLVFLRTEDRSPPLRLRCKGGAGWGRRSDAAPRHDRDAICGVIAAISGEHEPAGQARPVVANCEIVGQYAIEGGTVRSDASAHVDRG